MHAGKARLTGMKFVGFKKQERILLDGTLG